MFVDRVVEASDNLSSEYYRTLELSSSNWSGTLQGADICIFIPLPALPLLLYPFIYATRELVPCWSPLFPVLLLTLSSLDIKKGVNNGSLLRSEVPDSAGEQL